MSDTPRTDAKARDAEIDTSDKWVESSCNMEAVDADFARDLERELAAAKAEVEKLRADAERYRWMKQEVKRIPPGWELIGWDAAIDAALKEAK
jgi:hypothetical protein